MVQAIRISKQKGAMWQNSQPVVNTTLRVYYIVQGSKCYCVNMDTGVAGPAIA